LREFALDMIPSIDAALARLEADAGRHRVERGDGD